MKWLNKTDTNQDGKVSQLEYERYVIDSLEKAGYKFTDNRY